jgi:hypothetical protein
LNEAAIAWRRGDLVSAAGLARQARDIWAGQSRHLPAGLARALELAARGEAGEADVAELANQARDAAMPRLGAQIFGLLAHVRPDEATEWTEAARRLAESTPQGHWRQRLEVLSLRESVCEPPTDE